MSDQLARRVAIQHEVSVLADSYRNGLFGEDRRPVLRLTDLMYTVTDIASYIDDEERLVSLAKVLIRLQAEAQLWSESLTGEAAK